MLLLLRLSLGTVLLPLAIEPRDLATRESSFPSWVGFSWSTCRFPRAFFPPKSQKIG